MIIQKKSTKGKKITPQYSSQSINITLVILLQLFTFELYQQTIFQLPSPLPIPSKTHKIMYMACSALKNPKISFQ
jgi:hypothetical protein